MDIFNLSLPIILVCDEDVRKWRLKRPLHGALKTGTIIVKFIVSHYLAAEVTLTFITSSHSGMWT